LISSKGLIVSEKKLISIVLGSYNRLPFLKATLENARVEAGSMPFELIVVDGGSDDGSIEWLVKQKDVITIVQHNRGEWQRKPIERRSWGYFMNLGFKAAQGKYILMISDDCLLVPGAIKKGVEQFEKLLNEGNKVGALAFYWRNLPEDANYRVGLAKGENIFVNHGLFLREALKEVDWIDEKTYMFYYGDYDLALKLAKAGYKVLDASQSYVEHWSHIHQKTRNTNLRLNQQDRANYLEKWKDDFNDPPQPDSKDRIFRNYNDSANTAVKFPKLQKSFEINMVLHKYINLSVRALKKIKRLLSGN
jgi:GT2 family glycosyltransferase